MIASFFKTYRWLVPSLLFTLVMLGTRIVATGSLAFVFLAWNLFLAGLPLLLAYASARVHSTRPLFAVALAVGWLLFFPNALYLTTDLFHLRGRPPVPLWYDLLLLLSAAVNGGLYGLLSLRTMEPLLRRWTGPKAAPLAVFGALVLGGFGIYLGRYLRYNSWDVASAPHHLATDLWDMLRHPRRHLEVWAISGAFGCWSWTLYRMLRGGNVRRIG